MNVHVLLALAATLPLASAMLPTSLSADLSTPWAVCERLDAAECAADRCALCTRLDGSRICFTPQTAAKLPKYAFRCALPSANNEAQADAQAGAEATEAEAEETAAPPKPWQVCEALNTTECQAAADRCDLCTIMGSKPLCFEPKVAAKFPPGIFECTGPKPEPPTLEAAEKPMPKVICEMLNATECQAQSADCSLCTKVMGQKKKQLCFSPDIAAKLSPWAFKCTGAQPAAAALSIGRKAGPVDPEAEAEAACEALPLSECGAKQGCARCTRVDGWELCFSTELAAKLSPYAYQCQKLAVSEPAGEDKPKPAPWVPCESFPASNCTKAPECTLCTMPSGKPRCFDDKTAAKLPPAIFKCSKKDAPAAELAAAADVAVVAAVVDGTLAPGPAPWVPCESFPASNCTKAPECTLCTMPSGKPRCFSDKIAAKLPPAIFKCSKKGTSAAELAAAADMAAAADVDAVTATAPGPAPWTPCESFAPANCTLEPACTLCTLPSGKELCFNDKTAGKLPPAIFKCSKKDAPAAELAAAAADVAGDADVEVKKPEPAPWVPCESFPASNCTKAPECTLCMMPSGKPRCFDDKTAAKLPPAIFKCSKKAADEEVASPADVTSATNADAAVVDAHVDAVATPSPSPWLPCEAFPPANCTAATCALCTLETGKHAGKQLCFSPIIAAKLPPAVFQCTMPDEGVAQA